MSATLPSTDAVLASAIARESRERGEAEHDDTLHEERYRQLDKHPIGARIEHAGKAYEVALAPRCFPKGSCAGCAWCAVLEGPLDSCEAGGRNDGLDVVMREVVG